MIIIFTGLKGLYKPNNNHFQNQKYLPNFMPMKKKHYWIIGVVLLLVITNPEMKDFKEYLGRKPYYTETITRKYNFLIFSIYSDDINKSTFFEYTPQHVKFIGILKNFCKISNSSDFQDSTISDTVKVTDTVPLLPK